jgi:hypothetical protein
MAFVIVAVAGAFGCGEQLDAPPAAGNALVAASGGYALLWEQPRVPRGAMWQMSGTNVSVDSAFGAAPPNQGWGMVAGGDFDKDGHGDALWFNSSTRMLSMWRLQGATYQTFASLGPLDANTCNVTTGDFNGDGRSDILQTTCEVGSAYTSRVWISDSFGTIHAAAAATAAPGIPAAIADFNADGRSDIVYRKDTSVTIWQMNADGSHVTFNPGTATTDWDIVGAGDMNGNGIAELVWWNHGNGTVGTWQLTSPGVLLRYDSPWTVSLNWRPLAVADVTGDGIADVVWRHITNYVGIWEMASPISASEFGTALPAGADWTLRGVTPLAAAPPPAPVLPAIVAPSTLPAKSPKILMVPCRFSDRTDNTSVQAINNLVVQKIMPWFSTISYGAMTPVFTIPQQWFQMDTFATEYAWVKAHTRTEEVDKCVNKAMAQYNPSSFDVLVAVWNFDGDNRDVTGDGVADVIDFAGAEGNRVVLGPRAMVPEAWGTSLQELVHGLGIPQHSMSQDEVMYGDNWDVMSCTNCFSYNLNAVFRKRLVGLPANRSPVYNTSQTLANQTFVLAAMDRPDAPGSLSVQFDMIEGGMTVPYFIEYHTIGDLDLSYNIPRDSVLLHKSQVGTSFLMGRVGTGDPNWAPSGPLQSRMGALTVTTTAVAPVSGWAIVKVTKN